MIDQIVDEDLELFMCGYDLKKTIIFPQLAYEIETSSQVLIEEDIDLLKNELLDNYEKICEAKRTFNFLSNLNGTKLEQDPEFLKESNNSLVNSEIEYFTFIENLNNYAQERIVQEVFLGTDVLKVKNLLDLMVSTGNIIAASNWGQYQYHNGLIVTP